MKLEEAKEILLELHKNNTDTMLMIAYTNTSIKTEYKLENEAISTVLQEIERLQKENEELKNIDLTTVHIKGVCDEKERWRNKIKELILNKKQKIHENNAEIEECRKTIMEEQELKKLKLYTLHKNNELLELEIADMFDLLKEE